MNVLHVLPSLATRIGGPAVSAVESALALRRHGVDPVIFATDMGAPISAPHHSVSARDLPAGAELLDVRLFRSRPPRRWAYAPAMARALEEEVRRADLVHIHMLFTYPQFAAARAARRHGVPYIVSPCGALDPHLRRRSRLVKAITEAVWQGRMLDGAAAIHYKTPSEAALVAGLGLRARAAIAPNGIDWPSFRRLPDAADFRQRYVGGHEGPIVLALGRLSHKKGLDVLVRALAIAARSAPNAVLVVAGPDDEGMTPRLRQIASAEDVGHRVVFTGMLRGDERLAALASADVWALPSHTENFGLAVVEAMAAGLPTIISPYVNLAGDIEQARAGIVRPLDAAAFGHEIAALIGDPERRKALGRRARAFAERYDWGTVAPQWHAIYREAVAQHQPLLVSSEVHRAA